MTKRSRRTRKLTRAEYEDIYYSNYVGEKLGLGATSRKLDIPKTNLFRNFKKYDLPLRSNIEATQLSNRKWSDRDIEKIYQNEHINKKMTFEAISKVHGISPSRFSARCAKLGLKVRSRAEANECFWERLASEVLESHMLYFDDDVTVEEIAKEQNISTYQVYERFKHFGLESKRPRGSNLTDDDVSQIVKLNAEGQAPREIEENLGISSSTVRKVLKKLEIEPRKHEEAVNLALRRGRDKNRKSINANIKFEFFEQMTPQLAWFLGAVCSDGSIGFNYGPNKVTCSFSLASIDKDFVDKLGMLVGLSPSKSASSTSSKPIWTLRCSNKRFVNHLEGLGVHSNKSSTVTVPDTIPPELIRHFIRGYFEGDGCVSKTSKGTLRFSFSSKSEKLIRSVAEVLFEQAGIGICGKRRSLSHVSSPNCPCLTVYKRSAKDSDLVMYVISSSSLEMLEKLYCYLYQNVDEAYRMNRKFNVFKKALGSL
ncbi:LAGLIDADG family homing endonuclease [Alteromonas portus]|uniref:LAGLIDADG family homing endonuclease n=1 Tax=Alteromonas portus TaxID=2565549 RepID=UPI003BF91C0F